MFDVHNYNFTSTESKRKIYWWFVYVCTSLIFYYFYLVNIAFSYHSNEPWRIPSYISNKFSIIHITHWRMPKVICIYCSTFFFFPSDFFHGRNESPNYNIIFDWDIIIFFSSFSLIECEVHMENRPFKCEHDTKSGNNCSYRFTYVCNNGEERKD